MFQINQILTIEELKVENEWHVVTKTYLKGLIIETVKGANFLLIN